MTYDDRRVVSAITVTYGILCCVRNSELGEENYSPYSYCWAGSTIWASCALFYPRIQWNFRRSVWTCSVCTTRPSPNSACRLRSLRSSFCTHGHENMKTRQCTLYLNHSEMSISMFLH